eukprot:364463-Chlamydomonas_euryale.AAC.2
MARPPHAVLVRTELAVFERQCACVAVWREQCRVGARNMRTGSHMRKPWPHAHTVPMHSCPCTHGPKADSKPCP